MKRFEVKEQELIALEIRVTRINIESEGILSLIRSIRSSNEKHKPVNTEMEKVFKEVRDTIKRNKKK